MVKNLFFNYHCTQIVRPFGILDLFPHFYFVARGWFRTPASSGMSIFVTVVDGLLPSPVVTKSPFYRTEVVLVSLLVVSACLGRIKGVHYIAMSRGMCNFRHSAHQVLIWMKRANVIFLTSFKSKSRVLCGGSYTSPGLVLFGSIFDRIFDFIFLSFEPYTWLTLLPFYRSVSLVSVFSVSLPIKRPVQSQFQFLQNRV